LRLSPSKPVRAPRASGPALAGGGLRAAAALAVLIGAVGAASPALGGSIEDGREKIRSKRCVTCHDAQGQGTAPPFPNLAGQQELYLEQQLKAFRSGQRQAPQMSIMAKDLSDRDIADLAAYYSSLDPCGQ